MSRFKLLPIIGLILSTCLLSLPASAQSANSFIAWACSSNGGIVGWCPVTSTNPLPVTLGGVAGAVTANQGAPNTTANAWPIKNTDGTNVAAVKPASTAAVATDPALVIAVSPNGQLPAGQATMAASVPVVIASNQTAIPVNNQDGFGNAIGSKSINSTNSLSVVEPDDLSFTGTASSAVVIPMVSTQGTNNYIDMMGYESITVQVTGAGVATTLTYETSDDNVNFLGVFGQQLHSDAQVLGNTTTTASMTAFPKRGRYFRVRVSTYGSGTVTIVGNLHKNPQPLTNRVTVDGPNSAGSSNGNSFAAGVVGRIANSPVTATTIGTWVATLSSVGITKPYSIPEADWQANLSLANTSSQTLKTAGGAGVKNYITACQFSGVSTTVATSITILDAATVIWSSNILAGQGFQEVTFPTPLQTIANDAANIILGTTPVGAVAANCQGYQAAD